MGRKAVFLILRKRQEIGVRRHPDNLPQGVFQNHGLFKLRLKSRDTLGNQPADQIHGGHRCHQRLDWPI